MSWQGVHAEVQLWDLVGFSHAFPPLWGVLGWDFSTLVGVQRSVLQ